ncbi:MAG: AI-2E family transporter [Patescibacteria group bacterium]
MPTENNIHRLQLYFFFSLILGASLLTFFIFKPYLPILFLALVFAVVFEPIHKYIVRLTGKREGIAAFISVVLIFLLILIPLIFFGILLFQEASNVYVELETSTGVSTLDVALNKVEVFVEDLIPNLSWNVKEHIDFRNYAEQGLLWVLDNFGPFFSGVLRGLIGLFFLMIALFYFLKDGRWFLDSLISISPLPNGSDREILQKLKRAVRSVVNGYLLIAVLQGLLTGIGFAIFSVPNPVLWSFVTMIVSFLPLIGISLVFAPAIVILLLAGNIFAAFGLFLWSVCIVGIVDNILGPIFIERGVNIHPFLILVSIVGGLEVFGPVGFIAGPVVLSLLFALLEMHVLMFKKRI